MTQDFACALDAWLAGQCGAKNPGELPDKLARAQFHALTQTLAQARTQSAYYAQSLAHCPPLRSLADLPNLPLTEKQATCQWQQFLTCPLDAIERMVTLTSSGTTGPPKRIAFSHSDLARSRDFFAVGMRLLVASGMTVCVLLPGAARPHGVADLLRSALAAHQVRVLSCPEALLADQSAQALADWLCQISPHVLVAMPTYLQRLCDLSCPLPRLSGILTSAEPLWASLSRQIHQLWACELLDHYGMTETGYGLALECPAHAGLHLRALDVLVEIVDLHGLPLPMGEEGEIVITTLRQEAMPLIRYRTGDVGRLLPGPCACHSPLPRLARVRGRLKTDQGKISAIRQIKGMGWKLHTTWPA